MAVPVEKKRYTVEEYFDIAEASLEKQEFHDGEILAMSGTTYAHVRIATNLTIALGNALKGKPCQPLGSDMRNRIPGRQSYVYPDITIICGPPVFDPVDRKKRTIVNPTAIIEILSESTERYDRTRKFEMYRDNPSIQEYVLVAQEEASVETFLRQPEGAWLMHPYKGLDATATLRSIAVQLPLKDIYDGVTFDAV